ncbi:unnamed protein product [Ectocarpus sp. CCAP 1310/34]|nr:unnamed protein product [Ectocarpus sp. CCAP 1310/34]
MRSILGPPEGSSRLYAELEDRLKIFDKGNHSMFKGLEDGHNSLETPCVSFTEAAALRFTTRPGRPVGELLHSDVITEDSAKIAFSPYLQGGDHEAEGNDIMHNGLDAGAVGFLSDSDSEEGERKCDDDDAGPGGLGDQVERNAQEGDGDEPGHENGHDREGHRQGSAVTLPPRTAARAATGGGVGGVFVSGDVAGEGLFTGGGGILKLAASHVNPPQLKKGAEQYPGWRQDMIVQAGILDIGDVFSGGGVLPDINKPQTAFLEQGFSYAAIRKTYLAWNFLSAALTTETDKAILRRCTNPREALRH